MYLVREKTISVLWRILTYGLSYFTGRDTLDEDDVDWRGWARGVGKLESLSMNPANPANSGLVLMLNHAEEGAMERE